MLFLGEAGSAFPVEATSPFVRQHILERVLQGPLGPARCDEAAAAGEGGDHPKTKAGVRTIAIPKSLVDLLRDRQAKFKIRNDHDLVFPTMRGNIRDPRNTSRDWRMARDRIGYPTVTTHSFRKTVATALDQSGLSAREIAEYLGHANPSLTQDVYMAKNTGGIRAAETMNSLLSTM